MFQFKKVYAMVSPLNPYLLIVHSLTYGLQLWAILHIAKAKYAMSYICKLTLQNHAKFLLSPCGYVFRL